VIAAPSVYIGTERTAVPCAEPGAFNVFDLSITKLLVLAVLALLIFGPDQLPKVAAQAGRALRDLRRLADVAKADLKEGLGPEFADFDMNDLNPRNFVRKHLLDDLDLGFGSGGEPGSSPPPEAAASTLAAGESPPYDAEAT
jgi:sec-independent protein translocase protein TatB